MTVDVLLRAEDVATGLELAELPPNYFDPTIDQCSNCPEDSDVPPAEYLIGYRYGGKVYLHNACGYCLMGSLRYLLFGVKTFLVTDITLYT